MQLSFRWGFAVPILMQFIYRLSFGLAVAMALTSSRQVPNGYFRVHLYVLLGLNALATLIAFQAPHEYSRWPPLAAALVSYAGSICWLYELKRPGKAALWIVSAAAICGAWLAGHASGTSDAAAVLLHVLDPVTGGLVLGSTMAAMLLGHWYLNTPSMQLDPLKRLIALLAVAIVARAVLAGTGLGLELAGADLPHGERFLFVLLRWLAGIIGTFVVAVMAWQTLKIPNTQSATGILYVGVVTTFLGELTAQLLTTESIYPL